MIVENAAEASHVDRTLAIASFVPQGLWDWNRHYYGTQTIFAADHGRSVIEYRDDQH